MTAAEFRALPSKPYYERGDRVLTWDRASRPVLPGIVWGEYRDHYRGVLVGVDRSTSTAVALPRWRVRLAPA